MDIQYLVHQLVTKNALVVHAVRYIILQHVIQTGHGHKIQQLQNASGRLRTGAKQLSAVLLNVKSMLQGRHTCRIALTTASAMPRTVATRKPTQVITGLPTPMGDSRGYCCAPFCARHSLLQDTLCCMQHWLFPFSLHQIALEN